MKSSSKLHFRFSGKETVSVSFLWISVMNIDGGYALIKGPFHYHHNLMEISVQCYPNSNRLSARFFLIWHDICIVVASATIYSNIISRGLIAVAIFLTKYAPGSFQSQITEKMCDFLHGHPAGSITVILALGLCMQCQQSCPEEYILWVKPPR